MDLIIRKACQCKLQFIFSRNFSPSGDSKKTSFFPNLVKKKKNWVKGKKLGGHCCRKNLLEIVVSPKRSSKGTGNEMRRRI